MKILSLGYLGFETPQYADWLTFGPQVMGLGLGGRGPDGAVLLKMDDRKFRLALHPGDVNRVRYIGWELRDLHAFEAALEELTAAGQPFELASREQLQERGVAGMVRLEDPAGFPHEIYYGQAFWPNSFLRGRPMAGFLADELGLGHLILGVPEFTPQLHAFVVGILGFSVFSAFDFAEGGEGKIKRLEFYRCNRRTHVLGYAPFPGRKGLHHVGIDTLHLDDVGTCMDLCEQHQAPLVRTLGRNVMDDTVSFYFRAPGGFLVEYGSGARLVDDDDFIAQTPQAYPHIWGHKLLAEEILTDS